MGVTIDVFIKFQGSKRDLVKTLSKSFGIRVGGKDPWFLGFIELCLTSLREDSSYFEEREFRPYNFALGSTTYAWSSRWGEVRDAHTPIMDVLAQMVAGQLQTRTMIYGHPTGTYRRYRYASRTQKKKGWFVIDEETKRPPKGLYQ